MRSGDSYYDFEEERRRIALRKMREKNTANQYPGTPGFPDELVDSIKEELQRGPGGILIPGRRVVVVSPYEKVNKTIREALPQMVVEIKPDVLSEATLDHYPYVDVGGRENRQNAAPVMILDFERVIAEVDASGIVQAAMKVVGFGKKVRGLVGFNGYDRWSKGGRNIPYFQLNRKTAGEVGEQIKYDGRGNFITESVDVERDAIYHDLEAIKAGHDKGLRLLVRS